MQPLHVGPSGDLRGVAGLVLIAVVLGFVRGSKIAFNWAPTVLVSLPLRCHMPSRRCFSSR
jgi:hypothetical protein